MEATVLWSAVSAIGAALITAGASYYAARLPVRAKTDEAQSHDVDELSTFRRATIQWLETIEQGMAGHERGEVGGTEEFDKAVAPFRETAEELFYTNPLLRQAGTGQRVFTLSQLAAARNDEFQGLSVGDRASRTLAALRCMTNEVRTNLASGNPGDTARQKELRAALEGVQVIRASCIEEIRIIQSQPW